MGMRATLPSGLPSLKRLNNKGMMIKRVNKTARIVNKIGLILLLCSTISFTAFFMIVEKRGKYINVFHKGLNILLCLPDLMPKRKIDKNNLVVIPGFRVKYKDIFDIKGFYESLHEWLMEYNWKDPEDEL